MWELLQTVAGKVTIITGSVFGVITLLEKTTSLKIWSLLKKWMKKWRDKKYEGITSAVKDVSDVVVGIRDEMEENRVKDIKYNLTCAEARILNGEKLSLRQYDIYDELIYEYEEKYKDRHNGEIKDTIAFLREQEKICRDKILKENQKGR